MSSISSIPVVTQQAETPDLYKSLRKFWHPVAYSTELKEDPIGATLLGQSLAIARIDGRIVAMDSRCAHKGASLALGKVVNGTIECPYHGWRYDGAGQCVRIPAREEMTGVIKASVRQFHASESAGIIWVALETPEFPAPVFPEIDDAEYKVLQGPTYTWRTSAPRRLENFVDFGHFAYVHDGSIGSRDNPRVDPVEIWREEHILRFNRSGVKEPGVGLKKQLLGIEEDWIEPVNEYHVTMPHTVHLKRTFPNGKRYVLFMAASPVNEHETRSFWWQARDFGTDAQYDDFFMDFEAEVLAQDKPIIESQLPVWIDFSSKDRSTRETPVRGADAVTIEYRRWLNELIDTPESTA